MPRIQSSNEDEERATEYPPVSIVLYSHDLAHELEHNLSLFLHQNYEGTYKVIVVIDKGDAEAEDILKRYAHEPHLYTTYIPDTSRYMSRKKLAITIGVKAAKSDWVIITAPTCRPADSLWLSSIARKCRIDKNLVVSFTQYTDNTTTLKRFYHLLTESYLLRRAFKGIAFNTDSPCVAFRKKDFIGGNGFLGNLQYNCGEYSFIVNKYAAFKTTAIHLDSAHPLIEDFTSPKAWKHKRLYYNAIRHALLRRHSYHAMFNFDMTMLHLSLLVNITLIILAIIIQNWIVAGSSAFMLIIWIFFHTLFGKKAANHFGVEISVGSIVPLLIYVVWYHLLLMIRLHAADKNDFTTHKL
ncbi:glycosyltransferase [Prevotella sp. oral taxon 820]|uniref:glycosyltransferase n=1 Tax=Prevotella sp. oral taxon 820 TaxID=2081962 RepID=UPI001304F1D9|nr:glycosyltransferase [Prevotella sp. oral taxon 820]